ncbi:acetolactate synthase large subunit [Streptomyces sp. NPDC051453]|uniref:acetolactate synthase large subunit n=1 Tax=Streptomyces sp. NPDC051453 TaxID=3154941 RepID=UPI003439A123
MAWSPSVLPFSDRKPRRPAPVASGILDAAVSAVQSGLPTTILLGGPALSPAGLRAADRISQATDARILMETFPARIEQGAGMPSAQRLAYDPNQARAQLAQTQDLVLAGARPPISFYACPDEPSELAPHGCRHLALGEPGQDIESALEFIADELADGSRPRVAPRTLQPKKKGRLSILPRAGNLSLHTMAQAIAATLPEDCIVVEETISSNAALGPAMARTTPHTLLTLIGGALGQGLPAATGAAIAAHDRPVLALESDGSVLFTIQALWTQAREHLNVTTVIINNSSCQILQAEFPRFGNQQAETAAERILELTDPSIDFVALSEGLGVPARRVTTSEQLISALHDAYADSGPHVIEAVVPRNG